MLVEMQVRERRVPAVHHGKDKADIDIPDGARRSIRKHHLHVFGETHCREVECRGVVVQIGAIRVRPFVQPACMIEGFWVDRIRVKAAVAVVLCIRCTPQTALGRNRCIKGRAVLTIRHTITVCIRPAACPRRQGIGKIGVDHGQIEGHTGRKLASITGHQHVFVCQRLIDQIRLACRAGPVRIQAQCAASRSTAQHARDDARLRTCARLHHTRPHHRFQIVEDRDICQRDGAVVVDVEGQLNIAPIWIRTVDGDRLCRGEGLGQLNPRNQRCGRVTRTACRFKGFPFIVVQRVQAAVTQGADPHARAFNRQSAGFGLVHQWQTIAGNRAIWINLDGEADLDTFARTQGIIGCNTSVCASEQLVIRGKAAVVEVTSRCAVAPCRGQPP